MTVNINGDYLRAYLKEHGHKYALLSKKMGLNPGTLSTYFSKGEMSDMSLRLLCAMTGADYKKATTFAPEKKVPASKENPEDTAKTIYDCTQFVLDDVKQLAKDMDDLKREVRETRAQMLGALKDIHATLKEIKQHNISVEVEKRQTRISMNKAVQEARGYVEKMSGILQARK